MPDRDREFLRRAARLAWRGHGGAEPNPLVGCVIVAPDAQIVGWGYHRTFGQAHAEIIALHRAGNRAAGATLYSTLEPCNHQGKTGPCAQAIINAQMARVVIARRDPNPIAAGGMERLRAAGVKVEVNDRCEEAIAVSDPFAFRLRSGLPWVIAKWAQTIDGKIATPTGESKWISNQASRTMVHRERGRMDAILTGIGTVRHDDPMLTARGVRVRRVARRIVIDPKLQISHTAKLVATCDVAPTIIICGTDALESGPAQQLRDRDVELIGIPMQDGSLPLGPALRELVARHDITNVLVESGPGLLGRLFQQKLVNEAWVFIAPRLLGDEQAISAVSGLAAPRLTDGVTLNLLSTRRRGGDVIVRYRVR